MTEAIPTALLMRERLIRLVIARLLPPSMAIITGTNRRRRSYQAPRMRAPWLGYPPKHLITNRRKLLSQLNCALRDEIWISFSEGTRQVFARNVQHCYRPTDPRVWSGLWVFPSTRLFPLEKVLRGDWCHLAEVLGEFIWLEIRQATE